MQQGTTIRLNKFISDSGLCSRREADRFIENGVVFINGRRAVVGDQVKAGDRVRVNGIELAPREAEDDIIIALNKPVGVTSTTEKRVSDNIVSFVNHSKRIFPIGRLDKDSQGLILLTNNGDIVNKILRAGNKHEKEYIVTVNKPLTEEVIAAMANGVPMLGVTTKKCKVTQEGVNRFRIILVQGLNRQIRRMCAYFDYEVVRLERVRIMNIDLKGLPLGEWRDLTEEEKRVLYSMVEKSSATERKKSQSAKGTPKGSPKDSSKGNPKDSPKARTKGAPKSGSKGTSRALPKGKPERSTPKGSGKRKPAALTGRKTGKPGKDSYSSGSRGRKSKPARRPRQR